MNKWHGTFLISGTTIGASMLALPLTSLSLGFVNSTLLLIVFWLFMVQAAYLRIRITHNPSSMPFLMKERFGKLGFAFSSVAVVVLFWALLSAYMAGASSLLCTFVPVPTSFWAIIYMAVMGYVMMRPMVHLSNSAVMIVKIIIFSSVIGFLIPSVTFKTLIAPKPLEIDGLLKACPLFFAAFGFHGSIPVLMQNLNQKDCYFSLLWGSFIAFVIYMLWQMIMMGILTSQPTDLNQMIACVSPLHPLISVLLTAFSFLAITTSFMGVGLGLLDYMGTFFHHNLLKSWIATFVIPLGFTLFYPTGFVAALSFAAIFLSFVAIVFPCLLVQWTTLPLSQKINTGIIGAGGVGIILIEIINMIGF